MEEGVVFVISVCRGSVFRGGGGAEAVGDNDWERCVHELANGFEVRGTGSMTAAQKVVTGREIYKRDPSEK